MNIKNACPLQASGTPLYEDTSDQFEQWSDGEIKILQGRYLMLVSDYLNGISGFNFVTHNDTTLSFTWKQSGLGSDGQTVRYYKYGTDNRYAKHSVFSNFGDDVRYGAKLPSSTILASERSSAPTPPISTSSINLSHVDATQCFPEWPWG
jgi:hypothetical protein